MATDLLAIGIDPGVSGSVGVVADGKFAGVFDIPVRTRPNGRQEIAPADLHNLLKRLQFNHAPKRIIVVIEDVNAMPPRHQAGKAPCPACGHSEAKGMGATSAFQFGRTAGAIEACVAVAQMPMVKVQAQKWKRDTGMVGRDKDYCRSVALDCFPEAAPHLTRKKDQGRAEALLIARWGYRMERHTPPDDPFAHVEPTRPVPTSPAGSAVTPGKLL